MTETESVNIEFELLKRYLYDELNEAEREKLENDFFLNDELFFEVLELENRLIDQYAKGRLSADEIVRFESSLEKFPDRKQKVANATALQTYIEEERPRQPMVPSEGLPALPSEEATGPVSSPTPVEVHVRLDGLTVSVQALP